MCEAQKTRGFEYIDEQSISDELKCSICTEPFIDPVVTSSCDHTFCRSGIESALKRKAACPDCRHEPLSSGELKPSGRILLNLLNRLLVRCTNCRQTNIQRGLFDDHIKKLCPKVDVACSAVDLKCEWRGPRDQLSNHLANCMIESMRPILGQFIPITERIDRSERENEQLKLKVAALEQRCNEHEIEIQQLKQKMTEKMSRTVIENLRFHPTLHNPNVTISEAGLKAVTPASGCTRCMYAKVNDVSWQHGRHYWEITLETLAGCYASMGVAISGWTADKRIGDDSYSWALRIYNNHSSHEHSGLRHDGKSSDYYKLFPVGTRVGALLDSDEGTLEYIVDGAKKGVAFNNLKGHTVSPIFEFCHNTTYRMNHNAILPPN
ncbi:unnamed protein product [Rotaria socialis]|uniref:Uncharacterized protein n=1 Tax=Rotaria socialis TaxID=392032 RepID=A0A818H316_9BILA|nr:unnamed protein product [Rotaria socialis]